MKLLGKITFPVIFVLCLLIFLIMYQIQPLSSQASSTNNLQTDDQATAQIAYIDQGLLRLLITGQKDLTSLPVTTRGTAEIIGWSHDGQWLSYKLRETEQQNTNLWVVSYDGENHYQIGAVSAYDTPAWSPHANTIAFVTAPSKDERANQLQIAEVGENSAHIRTLTQENSGINSFSWAPDGQSLAFSYYRTRPNDLKIERITLDGNRSNLVSLGKPTDFADGIYLSSIKGLTWSPDGKYLTYFVLLNSASLSADGVLLQLLEVESKQTRDLGGSLAYPEWLDWSSDSRYLAFIQGGGREATANKRLFVVDTYAGFKIEDDGLEGYVDTQPRWSTTEPDKLLFLRGKETTEWIGETPTGVLVPDQRIWQRTATGETKQLTAGQPNTADYFPFLSPNQQELIYLRLTQFDRGSIQFKNLISGEETTIVEEIHGDPGYYGNYLPKWLHVHWNKTK